MISFENQSWTDTEKRAIERIINLVEIRNTEPDVISQRAYNKALKESFEGLKL